ncbi:hypothetical protein CASFOL_034775 [Castilleja foliolosa]|uniref:Nucleotidyl transferase domain-containing protein n=1 Tax=Castilleja foliolosa TaxID=1961234 RepID=A0ABD3BRM6_9LAMI
MQMLCSWYPKISLPSLYYNPNLSIKNSQQPGCPKSLFPPANQSVAAIVFGDGSSSHSRLYPLTKRRSEAAIPIAGNYRLIDAVVSNCINSGITKIYAITQFNSTSLNSHISRAYSGARLSNDGFVEVIAAYQSPEDNGWFQGTADAIRRCLWMLEEYPVTEFLVLPGHHLYKMDYHKLIEAHRRTKADITVSVLISPKNDIITEDVGFGIFKLNDQNQVVEFRENPETMVTMFDHNKTTRDYASMGIYAINRDVMIKLLTEYFPTVNDLKSHVIPGALSLGMKIYGYGFDGHWEDMRSISAYYKANMETLWRTNKSYSFYDRDYPLYTMPRHLPPTLVTDAVITDSFIGDGCVLSKCRIKGTVVGMRTRIRDDAVIEDSVIMGSDSYHHHSCGGVSEGEANDEIPVGIGEGSYIRKAIIDKNARIGKNVMMINKENVVEGNMEAKGYIISGGIIVIIRGVVIPDGTIL